MKENKNILVGVIAGTPVDTALGYNFLQQQGFDVVFFAISHSPQEQNDLQQNHVDKLQATCLEEMIRMQELGVEFILIYCSSLSSVLNVCYFREILKISVYTPLDCYSNIANSYTRFGVVAANATGLNGFENAIMNKNKLAKITGMHNINIVREIENEKNPNKIIVDNALFEFVQMIERLQCECIVLACTHFSYIKLELLALTQLPLLDIDSELLKLLRLNDITGDKPGT